MLPLARDLENMNFLQPWEHWKGVRTQMGRCDLQKIIEIKEITVKQREIVTKMVAPLRPPHGQYGVALGSAGPEGVSSSN